ncbi:MAG: diguanylate cyclase [Saccharospirillum sp.]
MSDIEAKIKALTDAFEQRLPSLRQSLTEQWRAFAETPSREHLHTLHLTVHSLKGSSGTFGFVGLSEHARQFEQSLRRLLDASGEQTQWQRDQLDRLSRDFARLDTVLAQGGGPNTATPTPTQIQGMPAAPAREQDKALYYVQVQSARTAEGLLGNLEALGIGVRPATLESLQALAPESGAMPVVILDLGTQASLRALLGPLKLLTRRRFRVLVLTPRADFATDLTLLRVGAFASLSRPLSSDELTRTVMRALDPEPAIACRILMVDDQSDVAAFFQALLQSAGMTVKVVLDPSRIYEQIDRFDPDILLLDVNMPMASGLEVAQAVRLHERYLALPILFLTGEESLERTNLIDVGSDDILSKSMAPAALVSQLRTRALRARQIRAKMTVDALSGLYNHGHIQHLAKQAFGQASNSRPLTLAMLDLDHFKQVNDTWGHDVGDQVITELSQLLRLRLRSTDLVGRYGGEEFMVLMPATPAEVAVNVINEVRETFSRMTFNAGETAFQVTFSAGLCDSRTVKALDTQFKQADDALYRAKKGGRNRVEVAS